MNTESKGRLIVKAVSKTAAAVLLVFLFWLLWSYTVNHYRRHADEGDFDEYMSRLNACYNSGDYAGMANYVDWSVSLHGFAGEEIARCTEMRDAYEQYMYVRELRMEAEEADDPALAEAADTHLSILADMCDHCRFPENERRMAQMYNSLAEGTAD